MWVGVLLFLLVLAIGIAGVAIGVAGVSFIEPTWLTGWIVMIVTILIGIIGLLLLFALLRLLVRLSLGAAVSPGGDPPGKVIAITFAAILCTIAWAIRVARRENLVFCPAG